MKKLRRTDAHSGKGGVQKALKILALPRRGGEGGSDPCQDFFGGFDLVHRGQLKVMMDP